MIFIDTNILFDVTNVAGHHHQWSQRQLSHHTRDGAAIINHIVLAEFSARIPTLRVLNAIVAALPVEIRPLTDAAAFRAGSAFADYRLAGGPRTAILPDFLVGAHAAVLGIPLITRDRARFASYFPELAIISPETHP